MFQNGKKTLYVDDILYNGSKWCYSSFTFDLVRCWRRQKFLSRFLKGNPISFLFTSGCNLILWCDMIRAANLITICLVSWSIFLLSWSDDVGLTMCFFLDKVTLSLNLFSHFILVIHLKVESPQCQIFFVPLTQHASQK